MLVSDPIDGGRKPLLARWWLVNPTAPVGQRVLAGPMLSEAEADEILDRSGLRAWVVEVLGETAEEGRWGARPVDCPELPEQLAEDLAAEAREVRS